MKKFMAILLSIVMVISLFPTNLEVSALTAYSEDFESYTVGTDMAADDALLWKDYDNEGGTNGYFKGTIGSNGWTSGSNAKTLLVSDTKASTEGGKSMAISSWGAAFKEIDVLPGMDYTLTVKFNADAVNWMDINIQDASDVTADGYSFKPYTNLSPVDAANRIQLYDKTLMPVIIKNRNNAYTANEWTEYAVKFTSGEDLSKIVISFAYEGSNYLYIDDISLTYTQNLDANVIFKDGNFEKAIAAAANATLNSTTATVRATEYKNNKPSINTNGWVGSHYGNANVVLGNTTYTKGNNGPTITTPTAQDGNQMIVLTTAWQTVAKVVNVKANTNYTLNYWYYTDAADTGFMKLMDCAIGLNADATTVTIPITKYEADGVTIKDCGTYILTDGTDGQTKISYEADANDSKTVVGAWTKRSLKFNSGSFTKIAIPFYYENGCVYIDNVTITEDKELNAKVNVVVTGKDNKNAGTASVSLSEDETKVIYTATPFLNAEFLGWFKGEDLYNANESFELNYDDALDLTAKFNCLYKNEFLGGYFEEQSINTDLVEGQIINSSSVQVEDIYKYTFTSTPNENGWMSHLRTYTLPVVIKSTSNNSNNKAIKLNSWGKYGRILTVEPNTTYSFSFDFYQVTYNEFGNFNIYDASGVTDNKYVGRDDTAPAGTFTNELLWTDSQGNSLPAVGDVYQRWSTKSGASTHELWRNHTVYFETGASTNRILITWAPEGSEPMYLDNITLSTHTHVYDNDCDEECNLCKCTRVAMHNWSDWRTVEPATCSSVLVEYRYCLNECSTGYEYRYGDPDPNVHAWQEWTETTPGTCTTPSISARVCSYDSSHIQTKTGETNPDNHVYDDNTDTDCNNCGTIREITLTPAEIINAAYALGAGESLEGTYTLTGIITEVNAAFSSTYGNITVTILVENLGDKKIQCLRLKKGDATTDADLSALAVGDTITVSGTLKNYNGTIEFDSGCTLDSVKKASDIIAELYALTAGQSLTGKYALTGVISSIATPWNYQYSNISVIMIVNGDEAHPVQAFRIKGKDAAGEVIDDVKNLAVGDTITIYGTLKRYNNIYEFDSGCELVALDKAPAQGGEGSEGGNTGSGEGSGSGSESTTPTTLATFEFGDNVEAGSKNIDANPLALSGKKSYTEGNYTLTLTDMAKVYDKCYDDLGNSCLKLGTSSAAGKFTFTVPENVTSVILKVTGYKAKTSKIKVNGSTTTINSANTTLNGQYQDIVIDTTTTKTVSVETVNGGYRVVLNTIIFTSNATSCSHSYDNDCDDTCNSCGEVRTAPHTYAGDCDIECNDCGNVRTTSASHVYSHDLDATCNICGAIREVSSQNLTIIADEINGVAGTTVDVKVYLYNNAEFGALSYYLYFDNTKLTLVSVDKSLVLPEGYENDHLDSAIATANNKGRFCHGWLPEESSEPGIFAPNITYSGVIATYKFTIKEDVEVGTEIPLTITINDCYLNDLDVTDVEVTPVAGKITVIHCDHTGNENVLTETKTPTCTEPGEKSANCSVCGKLITEEIPVVEDAHAWGEYTETVPGTCTTPAKLERVCSHNAAHKETKDGEVNPNNHVWGEWTVTRDPSCVDAGEKQRECTENYTHVETAEIGIDPTAHNWGAWHGVRKANCTDPGEKQRICSDNAEHIEIAEIGIKANDHIYDDSYDAECNYCNQVREVPVRPANSTTIYIDIKDYATANNWVNGEKYYTINADDNVTINMSGTGDTGNYYNLGGFIAENGIYYTNDSAEWQIFSTGAPYFTITATPGKTIRSVKIFATREVSTTLLFNDENVEPLELITVNANSESFTIDHPNLNNPYSNSAIFNITGIEITYADAVEHNHVYDDNCDDSCYVCGEIRIALHNYTSDCDTVCDDCGNTREATADHTYTNACDVSCNICGETRTAPHNYAGDCDKECDDCGTLRETTEPHAYTNACDVSCDVCGKTRTAPHNYASDCDKECETCGNIRETTVDHTYTSLCDIDCDYCFEVREAPHNFTSDCDEECDDCGTLRETLAEHRYTDYCDANCNDCGYTRRAPHQYSSYCDRICDGCSYERTVTIPHAYTSVCDSDCDYCLEEREAPHNYISDCDKECDGCGLTRETAIEHNYDDKYDADCNSCGEIREVPERPIELTTKLNGITDSVLFIDKLTTITVTVDESFIATSGLIRISLGDGIELVSGQWLIDGDIKDFDISKGNGVYAILDPTEITGNIFSFVVKGNVISTDKAISVSLLFKNIDKEVATSTTTVNVNIEEPPYIRGDANGDGFITIKDITAIKRYLAYWDGITFVPEAADANQDGEVTIKDITYLKRHLAYWDGYDLD